MNKPVCEENTKTFNEAVYNDFYNFSLTLIITIPSIMVWGIEEMKTCFAMLTHSLAQKLWSDYLQDQWANLAEHCRQPR